MSVSVVNDVRRGFYLDSVALMRISARVSALPGVVRAALMIGSESNKQILEDAELLTSDGRGASSNDLVIAVRAESEAAAQSALADARKAIESREAPTAAGERRPKSLRTALDDLPGANLALISVPGEFAAREARKAVRSGLNVMIFSDNVPIEDERRLKEEARERGVLLMGPDCGTALINGVPLAFANAIPQGDVGAVSASGTGLQEFSVLIARHGLGLSHGVGVGGRDLNDEIGGLSAMTALTLLEADPATRRIVLISKLPGSLTASRLIERVSRCEKPVVLCFLGGDQPSNLPRNARFTNTLRGAAELVLGHRIAPHYAPFLPEAPSGRFVRGLFAGDSLCAEAQVLFREAGVPFSSNAPIPGRSEDGHSLIDLGDDRYTVGRPHPMIEPSVRDEMLESAVLDPETRLILMDIVLGYGAHPDPAGALVDVLARLGRDRPPIVTSVCGVPGDPQDYVGQIRKLESAGVIVAPSNAHAAEVALKIQQGRVS